MVTNQIEREITMTQEEKDLLLKDLCARLPYEVKLGFENSDLILVPKEFNIYTMQLSTNQIYPKSNGMVIGYVYDVWCYRPYLRPMSSMTTEEEYEYHQCQPVDFLEICKMEHAEMLKTTALCFSYAIDWLNKKGFDYRGLISMGLALEALEGMYKTE